MGRLIATLGLTAMIALSASAARAGEADDLQVMIDRARNGVADLERLDALGATKDETTVLRGWLDEAWRFRADQKYDEVRVVLDRCEAQTEMIRQKIEAARLAAQAKQKEDALRKVRENIEKTKKSIQEAMLKKAGLEARTTK
jgi:hypothetical protein